jgi:hypothetical protein
MARLPLCALLDFDGVQVIESDVNLGFGAGNNLALRALGFSDSPARAHGAPRAVFLLNPDTLVQAGAIAALYDALFSLPYAGLVGARLTYADGSLQHSAFRFPGLTQIALDLLLLPACAAQQAISERAERTLSAPLLCRRSAAVRRRAYAWRGDDGAPRSD